MTMTPQEFAAKWRGVTLKERSSSQEHFIDLCRMVGHPTPADVDPNGTFFTFERGVEKTGGGQGFADVWYKGHFAWEYKTRHSSLAEAYKQLLLYRDNLENPPLLVVCDIGNFEVRTNFTNTQTQTYRFTNDEIGEPDSIKVLRALFYDPDTLKPTKTVAQVTEEAAADFARLAPMLTARGIEPHRAAHFLIRALFCLFAEGVGLLPERLFSRVVENSLHQTETFEARTRLLFTAMAAGGMFGADNVPFFNGGLFNAGHYGPTDVVALEPRELEILHAATKRSWADIEPAIFGTLFERSLDPAKRSEWGAHYTSKADIVRIIEPVLMAPLRARWAEVCEQADEQAANRDKVYAKYMGIRDAGATTARRNAVAALQSTLTHFLDELGTVTVLDPACGSGNFLYVALLALLDLQRDVRTYAADHGVPLLLPAIGPQQLHGFDRSAYAVELAQVSVWIGYLQWMRQHYPDYSESPVLKAMDTVREYDAVLDWPDRGQPPRKPEWPAVYAIVGNPPFIGGKKMRSELGNDYVDGLFRVWDDEVPREADYVCYWFEKARAMLAEGKAHRVGLLATNSIRGGANREVLNRIKDTGDIFMAWDDEEWVLDGAAVRISLVGFDDGSETGRMLDGKPVAAINADLTAGVDLTRAQRLAENLNIAFMGDTKGGSFDLPPDVAGRMLAAPPNINGLSNADVVLPWVNGLDITRRPRGMFIVDFGIDMPMEQAAFFEQPFAWVERYVKPERAGNRREAYRMRWWVTC